MASGRASHIGPSSLTDPSMAQAAAPPMAPLSVASVLRRITSRMSMPERAWTVAGTWLIILPTSPVRLDAALPSLETKTISLVLASGAAMAWASSGILSTTS
eukprot:CAMPEP_0196746560 /NCGR_PEP_ID=MMETSP1091-20130531/66227_1 /TAXON_ID=302021 /ORGANISM="Rhodomonas sp., Strain CCMP768" /LENGTH=101 /DNA_ID=CAMNT_0042093551 /DNA_START=233 /DNA_END=538 /DNA_ORIENTATION=+